MTHTRKTYSTLHNQRGFTLVEILAILIIMAIFTTTAIAKYSDIEETADRRILETAVVQLNEHVRHAWFQSALASGAGTYSYYEGTLGSEINLTGHNRLDNRTSPGPKRFLACPGVVSAT